MNVPLRRMKSIVTDAKNVKVQFFNGPPSVNTLLGEQTIDVLSGESVALPLYCTLSDGIYTFYAVIDPDNSIFESCECNNGVSIEYLLDRTPPEAEIFFDPEAGKVAVKGVDNLDSSVDVSITEKNIRGKSIHVYTLTDDAGNVTELQLEINHNNHEIKAEIINLRYNGYTVAIPQNSFKIEYIIENGRIKMFNQFLIIGDTKVHLIYNGKKDQTKIIVNGTQTVEEGLALMMVRTSQGSLNYRIKNMR